MKHRIVCMVMMLCLLTTANLDQRAILFSDMANIILLLVIFMFVFAVIGVSLFAADSPHYFGNLETGILLKMYVQLINRFRLFPSMIKSDSGKLCPQVTRRKN